MKREIKFRGKCVCTGEWRYGNLDVQPDGRMEIFSRADGLQKGMVIPETVGQYTGQEDKDGKNIYEGDFVAFGDYRGAVCFAKSGGAFLICRDLENTDSGYLLNKDVARQCLVIGNIYKQGRKGGEA